jgi:hypothetical protein
VDCPTSLDIELATDKLRERIVQLRGRILFCNEALLLKEGHHHVGMFIVQKDRKLTISEVGQFGLLLHGAPQLCDDMLGLMQMVTSSAYACSHGGLPSMPPPRSW